jgi:hypothetical protein
MLTTIIVTATILFVYRAAKSKGHSAILWTTLSGLLYLCAQFLAGFVIGTFGIFASAFWGWPASALQHNFFLIDVAAPSLSAGTVMLVAGLVDKQADSASLVTRFSTGLSLNAWAYKIKTGVRG